MRFLVCCLLAAPLCLAQNWELGGFIAYGVYRNGSIDSFAGTAVAGIRNRFAAGAVLGQDMYEHISGEVRYTYHDGDPFLKSGGVSTNLQGQSHALHYDLLLHAWPREARLRPFVAIGAGIKEYVVTGPDNPFQPLHAIGVVISSNDLKFIFDAGFGVKYSLSDHLVARFDFRDYITPFPKKVLVPAPFATASGLLHQFTPMFGLSYRF